MSEGKSIDRLAERVAVLEARVEELSRVVDEVYKMRETLADVSARVDIFSKRLNDLEHSIRDLRDSLDKSVQDLKSYIDRSINGVKDSVNRTNSQVRWLTVALVTLSASLSAAIVSIVVKLLG